MISDLQLEMFQEPPRITEPDVGTVDPFTRAELAAVAEYNTRTGDTALLDCLDGIEVSGAAVFTDHESEFGRDEAAAYVKAHFAWLHQWYDALDSLDAGLRDGGGLLSNAADRLMTHQMREFLMVRDRVRAAALTYLIGDAGPSPNTEWASVMLSNGYVHI